MAMTKADSMVIKVLVCVILISAAVWIASCSPIEEPATAPVNVSIKGPGTSDTLVTIHFTQLSMEPMTRATLSESGMTHLDLWLSDGSTAIDVHQTSSDVGFGSVSQNLDKTKTYTLYAIAHKATSACTLTDGIIAYPDDKVKESFFYMTTFSPASTASINCEMHRITGKFTLQTTDAVPAEVDHFRFTIANTGTRFNASTQSPAEITDRIVDFASISRKNDGTCSFACQILSTLDAATNFTITATAYASDNSIIETKTFENVPIRNNYRTTLSGAFFTSSALSLSFTADDWNDYDTINF